MRYTFLLFGLFFTFFSYCQEENTDENIIIFDDDSEIDGYSEFKYNNPYGSSIVLKTSPLSVFYGSQFIEVEKSVLDFLSLEIGGGITFKNNVAPNSYSVFNPYSGCTSSNWPEDRDYCDDYYDTAFRSTKLGYTGMAAVKLYFANEAPCGLYLSFNVNYSRLNYSAKRVKEGMTSILRVEDYDMEKVNNLEYSVRFGWQSFHDPLISNFFIGFGVLNSNQIRQDLGYNQFNQLMNNTQSIKFSSPTLVLGLRIGIHAELNRKTENIINEGRKM